MRKRLTLWVCGVSFALALSATATADALRCGNKLMSSGDHAAKILHYCGEPAAVNSWVTRRGVIGTRSIFLPSFVEEVRIEEWTYNFGPRRLMRQLRLENGILREVKHLGYGYREP